MLAHGLDRRGARASPRSADGMGPPHDRSAARLLPGRHGGGGGPLGARLKAYPRSVVARVQYAMALQAPTSRGPPGRFCPDGSRARPGWRHSPEEVWPRYWWRLASTWHMTGEYHSELAITDRWRDSAAGEWQGIRGRALAALGREREVMELLASRPKLARVLRGAAAAGWRRSSRRTAIRGRRQPWPRAS